MPINLDALLIHVVINAIILGPVLWLSGRALVGKEKAKFTDGLWIAALGTVIGTVLGSMFSGIIAAAIILVVWLGLIKHFFDCGWGKAILIALIAVAIFIAIGIILGLIGFLVFKELLPSL
ncbi:MAG: hypothetical protein JTT11_05715 [Candidatus Brockarchaeota archaeon]|nr:hypothetical protein [Candidatus Brockarchaeota archaeon]